MMDHGLTALKQWLKRTNTTIVFDSSVDGFTDDAFFEKVRDKQDIAVIGFTTDGDVFGGFYSVALTEQDKSFPDPNMFIFSIESHGRCNTPQKFVVRQREKRNACVRAMNKSAMGFVGFWVTGKGSFTLGNASSRSACCGLSNAFEDIADTTLTGVSGFSDVGPFHHCTRVVAFQIQ